VSGTVYIKLKKLGTKLEHQGIRLEFVGQIGKKDQKRISFYF